MQVSKSANGPKYDAFISYSRIDKAFAIALEKALEAYRPPKDIDLPRRNLNIFRDEGDLIGNDYYEAIDANLQESAKLIVICSPNARSSAYVNDEIRRFAKIRSHHDFIPILLEGIPNNEADTLSTAEMAFPKALCDVLEIPLATHYKGFQPGKTRVNRGIFEGSWFTILANLYGIGRDVLEQREKKRKLHRRRLLTATISAVMAVIAGMAIFAWVQKYEADRQRYNAQKQLALNYWDNGRGEKEAGNSMMSFHLNARAAAACPDANLCSAIIQNTEHDLNAAVLRSAHAIAASEFLYACNENAYVLTEEKGTKQLQLLNAATGTPTGHTFRLEIPPGGIPTAIRFGCSPRRVLISILDSDKTGGGSIRLLNFETGRITTHHLDTGTFPIHISKDLKRCLIRTSKDTYQVRSALDGTNIGAPIKISQGGRVRFSDNGKHLLAFGYNGVLQLYDVQTGLPYKQNITHEDRKIFKAVLSPGSDQLVTWDINRQLRIWNLMRAVTTSFSISHEHNIHGAMYFKKNNLLLIWDAGLNAHILNPNSGKILISNLFHSHGRPIISPDERYILTFTKEGSLLWEAATGWRLAELFHPPIPRAVFLNHGKALITLDKDRSVRWWDLSHLDKRYRVVRPIGGVAAAQWGSELQGILTLSKWAVEQWEVNTGEHLGTILSRRTPADGFLYSTKANRIVVWGKRIGKEYFAFWKDGQNNKGTYLTFKARIEGALLSPDHNRLFVEMADGTAGLWQFDAGQMTAIEAFLDQKIAGGAFSPSSRHLLIWTKEGEAVLWDTLTSFDEATPFSPGLPVHGAIWSASHEQLLTWNRKGLATLWKRPIQQSDKITFQHGSAVIGGIFNKKAEQIVTWTTDNVIHFWDYQGNKTTLSTNSPISGLSISPDQDRILTWSTISPGQATLWDVASGREIIQYPHRHMKGCLGFSADPKYIVTHNNDEIRIWQLPGDLDFPKEAYHLKAEALTGTYLHEQSNSVRLLPRDEWLKRRQMYLEVDREHAKTCSFKHQNTYLNFFETEQLPPSPAQ